MSFTAAELTLQSARMRLRLEGQRVSPTELRLRNPRFILTSGAVVAGDLIVSAGVERGNGDGDFSQAMREVAGPTPTGGVALLSLSQSISIATIADATELFLSFGILADSTCASYPQFQAQVLPTLQSQCLGCHQTTFFNPPTDAGICQTLLSHTLPRDAANSPLLLRPQGALGHPVIGLGAAELSAIRSWIETEAALR